MIIDDQLDKFDFTFFEELENDRFDNIYSAEEKLDDNDDGENLFPSTKKQKISSALNSFNIMNVFASEEDDDQEYLDNSKSKGVLLLPEAAALNELTAANGDLEHLFNVPKLMEEYMGSEEDLIELLAEICTDDVVLQTSAMNRRQETGKQFITNLFTSATRTMPDMICILKTIKYNRQLGIITSVAYLSGTKIYKDRFDYLYNCLQSESSPVSVTPELRQKAVDIQARGERYQVNERVAYHFILTPDCSKIKRFAAVHHVIDVSQAPKVLL